MVLAKPIPPRLSQSLALLPCLQKEGPYREYLLWHTHKEEKWCFEKCDTASFSLVIPKTVVFWHIIHIRLFIHSCHDRSSAFGVHYSSFSCAVANPSLAGINLSGGKSDVSRAQHAAFWSWSEERHVEREKWGRKGGRMVGREIGLFLRSKVKFPVEMLSSQKWQTVFPIPETWAKLGILSYNMSGNSSSKWRTASFHHQIAPSDKVETGGKIHVFEREKCSVPPVI